MNDTENYKILLEENKENPNKWNDIVSVFQEAKF